MKNIISNWLSVNSNYRAFLLLTLPATLLLYTPILFLEFGFSDDYFALWESRFDNDWTVSALTQGRPLQGHIVKFLFTWAHDVIGLWKIRLIALLFLILNLSLFYKEFLISLGNKAWHAALVTTLIAFLPSTQILTAWPSTISSIIAFSMAFIAGQLLLSNKLGKERILTIGAALLLILISLLMYQASTAACMLPWLIRSMSNPNIRIIHKKFVMAFGGFVAVNMIYIVGFKFYQSFNELPVGRSAITDDVFNKVLWFYNVPFILSGSTVASMLPGIIRTPFVLITVSLSFIGVYKFKRYFELNKYIALVIIWAAVFPICYYSGILSEEKFPSYRTQMALGCVFIFFIAFGINSILKGKLKTVVFISILVVFSILGGNNLYNKHVFIQTKDWKAIRTIVNENSGSEINLVRAPYNVCYQQELIYRSGMDEFGVVGSSVEWATERMTKLAVSEDSKTQVVGINVFNIEDSIQYKGLENLYFLEKSFLK
ncbi:MAG: hypothetical protein HRT72_03715 [Flavobacteriales bacterium]|nr:hypothetical protein [Flavobacteriales bacterium]